MTKNIYRTTVHPSVTPTLFSSTKLAKKAKTPTVTKNVDRGQSNLYLHHLKSVVLFLHRERANQAKSSGVDHLSDATKYNSSPCRRQRRRTGKPMAMHRMSPFSVQMCIYPLIQSFRTRLRSFGRRLPHPAHSARYFGR